MSTFFEEASGGTNIKVVKVFSAYRASQFGVYQNLRWTASKDYKVLFVSNGAWNGVSAPSISKGSWLDSVKSTCHNGPSGSGYSVINSIAFDVAKGTVITADESNASHLHIFGIEK